MTEAGSIAAGLILIIAAGVFNGSWNASFSSKANLAVCNKTLKGKTENDQDTVEEPINDLMYHHAFALFQIYAALINIPICIFWAGGINRVNAIVAEAAKTPSSIVLVVLFSLLWGVGTLLFGLACKIAGVGLGTNLSMGIIAIIGTFLPLIVEDSLISAAGGVICIGLFICCIGLWLSTKAMSMKDEDECKYTKNEATEGEKDLEIVDDKVLDEDEQSSPLVESKNSEGKSEGGAASNDISLRTSTYMHLRRFTAKFKKSPTSIEEEKKYSSLQKLLICVATGVCASQLQFAFVFGQRITDLALGVDEASSSIPGSTHKSGGATIIWMLAISLGAPIAIVNGIYSSPVPLSSAIRTPPSRHLKLILTTSLPWISHIHIYGVCTTTLLPEKVAASIAWPMLMMITTGQALLLSVFLGEWKVASKETINTLQKSITVSLIGIAILMASTAVPTKSPP